MNIIITVGTYFPLKDGVQSVTGYLAEGLANKGHSVTIVTRMFETLSNEEVHNGVRIIRYPVDTIHAIHKGDIDGYRKLVVSLSNEADILITVCPQIVTTDVLLPVLDSIVCPKVLYMHGMHTFKLLDKNILTLKDLMHRIWNNIQWGKLYSKKSFFKQYDRVVQIHRLDGTFSFFEKKYGIFSDVIENAADDEFFSPALSHEKLNLPVSYAIYVANYIPRKNQIDTIKAFYEANTGETGLILIGSEETDYYHELMRAIALFEKKYGKKDVRVLTHVGRELIPEYVKNSKLYLMNSKWEVFPISLLEAMATGTPFISTDVGIAKFLPGGVIIDNCQEMSYWIEKLLSNEDTRKALGYAGKTYASANLTREKKVQEFETLLLETINKREKR